MGRDQDTPTAALPAKCVACKRPLDSPLFCSSCRRLYPADGLNLFELLGFAPRYDIDSEQLRRKYFELTRDVHPDRLGGSGEDTLRLSMQVTAQMNQAFRVLSDPVLRAEYLLELFGGRAAADDKHVPAEVLSETLELREEIEQARRKGDGATLNELHRRVACLFEAALSEVADLARRLPGGETLRTTLRGKLNAIRYYRKMLEQLQETPESPEG